MQVVLSAEAVKSAQAQDMQQHLSRVSIRCTAFAVVTPAVQRQLSHCFDSSNKMSQGAVLYLDTKTACSLSGQIEMHVCMAGSVLQHGWLAEMVVDPFAVQGSPGAMLCV